MRAFGGWPCCRKCSKRWRRNGRVRNEKPNRAKELRLMSRIDRVAEGEDRERGRQRKRKERDR